MSIRDLVDYFSTTVRKRWDNACYSVACDIEANQHYGDKDSFVFQAKLFIKTFFESNDKLQGFNMSNSRIDQFFKELFDDGLTEREIAAGLCNGDIEKPDWMATAESTDHIKVIDTEDGHSSFQMGFKAFDY